MKFTVDLQNKRILFHDSFTKKNVDDLFSMLNIDGMDEFSFDIYKEPNVSPNLSDNTLQGTYFTTSTSTNLTDTYNLIYNQGQILTEH